jgi:hypothetical protein
VAIQRRRAFAARPEYIPQRAKRLLSIAHTPAGNEVDVLAEFDQLAPSLDRVVLAIAGSEVLERRGVLPEVRFTK